MAYKRNYLDEQQGQGMGQGQGSTGGQVLAGNSGGGAGGAQSQQQPAAGSGWTNLNTYLEMNQGQTGGLADTYERSNKEVVDKAIGTDLIKNTQQDKKWSQPIDDAKNMTGQIKSGDLTKVDANQFKTIQGSQYQKPQNYGELQGYGDVLNNFKGAAERIDNINDYGTQQGALRKEFTKNYSGYNSGMGTLDTFLLRGDKDASARTQAFQEANKDYGSIKNADGTKVPNSPVSKRFQSDVTGVLDNFFTGQEGAFNTAKGEMVGAVGQRRAGIEGSVTPEMIARRQAEIAATNDPQIAAMIKQAGDKGIVTDRRNFEQYAGSTGTLDEADLLSESDWQALQILEGLDGGRSKIQDQARGDYGVSFDSDAAARWIADNVPPPPAPRSPDVMIGSGESNWANPTGEAWRDTGPKPATTVSEAVDKNKGAATDRLTMTRDAITSHLKKNPLKRLGI